MESEETISGVNRYAARLAALRLQEVVLFLPAYFYLWFLVDPSVIHYRMAPLHVGFPRTWSHLVELLGRPGGLVSFVSGYLFPYLRTPWLGALILCAVAWALVLLTAAMLRRGSLTWLALVRFAPAVALLVAFARYEYPMVPALGFAVALGAAAGYVRWDFRGGWVRAVGFLALAAAAYWVSAEAACFFALTCAGLELRRRRSGVAVVCALTAAVSVYLAGTLLFAPEPLSLAERLRSLWFLRFTASDAPVRWMRQHTLVAVMAGGLAVMVFVLGLLRPGSRRKPSKRPAKAERSEPTEPDRSGRPGRGWGLWALQTGAVLLVSASAVWGAFDAQRKLSLELGTCARERRWERLLDCAARVPQPRYSKILNRDVNRALYELGRLPEEMFEYPQARHGLWLVTSVDVEDSGYNPKVFRRIADTYYELGLINDAEHFAHEMLQRRGDEPSTLKLLAKVNLVKEQPEAARVFLGYLVDRNLDPKATRWARDWLDRLDAGTALQDPEVVRLRQCRLERDSANLDRSVEGDLLSLLESNRSNRMAFEYLMGHYLVARRPDKIVQNIDRLKDFDYERIPRHYQEALVIYMAKTGERPDLGGYEISDESVTQFNEVNRKIGLCRRAGMRPEEMYDALVEQYGGSYLFYYALGVSGVVR